MILGNLLIYVAVVTSVASTAVLAWAALRDESVADYGRYLVFASAGLLTAAFGLLAYQFWVTDYSNYYVWTHTADSISLFYRLSGTYAGVDGSLLLWATFVGLAVAWLARRVESREAAGVAAIGAAGMTAFVLLVANRTPFAPVAYELGEIVTGPMGMNPILLNPYMGIHPPITFLGYALTVPAFAIAVGHFAGLLAGEEGIYKRWLPETMSWLRFSWIMLTGAVALGALWSYNTLGWGGLWAWDAVEVALLVSWLLVSVTLHAVANYRRRGRNRLLAPTLTALTLPGVLLVRIVTQSGSSIVHSFGGGISEPLLAFFLVTLVVAIAPPLYRFLSAAENAEDADDSLLTLGNLLYLSVLVIGVLTFISVWGITMPIVADLAFGQQLSVGVDFYNLWSYPVAVVMLLLLGLYNDYVANGRRALRWTAGATVLTLVVAVIPMEGWTIAPEASGLLYGTLGSANAMLLFPPVAYVLVSVMDRLWTVIPRLTSRNEKIALTGRGLVHIGLALIILGAPFTYIFAASASGPVVIEDPDGRMYPLGEENQYAASATGYRTTTVPTVSEVAEYEGIREHIVSPDTIAGESRQNAIVTGEATDYRTNSAGTFFELDDTGVWVFTGEQSDPAADIGRQLWVQGRVTTGDDGRTIVEPRLWGFDRSGLAFAYPDRFRWDSMDLTISKYTPSADGQGTYTELTTATVGIRNYTMHQASGKQIYIDHGLLTETYVAPQQLGTYQGTKYVYLQVKEIPFMNLVRVGIAVMLLGGLLIWRYDTGKPEDWD